MTAWETPFDYVRLNSHDVTSYLLAFVFRHYGVRLQPEQVTIDTTTFHEHQGILKPLSPTPLFHFVGITTTASVIVTLVDPRLATGHAYPVDFAEGAFGDKEIALEPGNVLLIPAYVTYQVTSDDPSVELTTTQCRIGNEYHVC